MKLTIAIRNLKTGQNWFDRNYCLLWNFIINMIVWKFCLMNRIIHGKLLTPPVVKLIIFSRIKLRCFKKTLILRCANCFYLKKIRINLCKMLFQLFSRKPIVTLTYQLSKSTKSLLKGTQFISPKFHKISN